MQALRILVVVMGVMIVVGVAIVAVTIAKRSGLGGGVENAPETPAASSFGSVTVPLPPGTSVVEEMVGDGELILKLEAGDAATSYVVIDLTSGHTRGTIRAVEAP